METRTVYQEYLVMAQQNADYMNTLLWIFFVLVIIAPTILAIIVVIVGLISRPKCPNCGYYKTRAGFKTVKNADTTISEALHICERCKTQF
jgi:hypothetical protein